MSGDGTGLVDCGMADPVSAPPAKLTILLIYAHPDDAEFHAAGSMAKWSAGGHDVHAICATDGALGAKVTTRSSKEVAAARAVELAAAMRAVGSHPPIMLGFPDGFLAAHAEALRERLVYWIRKLRPDRVITFDPFKKYEIHPDHITAGRMASEASVFSCFPLLYPQHAAEGLPAVQPREVWYMGPLEHKPNRIIDVTETFQKKVDATLCHSSQMEMLADWFVKGADPANLTDAERGQIRGGTASFLDGMGRGMAMAFGGAVEIAELFYAIRVGPGHFDNYQQMAMEMLGAPPEEPVIG